MTLGRGGRTAPLLIALGVAVLTGGIYMAAPDFLYVVEFVLYDGHFHLRGTRPATTQLAIAAIDQGSLSAAGRWPSSRSVLAQPVRDHGQRPTALRLPW